MLCHVPRAVQVPALGCSRLLPPFRPYLPPLPSGWPLLQLHAARVAFLAFAALADVDTTVAPSRRRQLDTDTDTKRDTDGHRDGCGCGDGDGDEGGRVGTTVAK